MDTHERIPGEWISHAITIAQTMPEVSAVFFYGSRVTGRSRHGQLCQPESDLDVALLFSGRDEGERCGHAAFLRPTFEDRLSAAVGHVVHIHVEAIGEDDTVVRPGVQEHGMLVYERPL